MSTITDQVLDHLRKTAEGVTAAAIGERIGAAPLIVGKALDELQGLGHARADSLHRWRITEKGRMANSAAASASDPSPVQAPAAGTIAARLLEAISTDGHTATELMTISGLTKVQVQSNLASLKSRGHAHTDGMRAGEPIWRLGGERKLKTRPGKCSRCGGECWSTGGGLCRDCYLANAEAKRNGQINRAVIAKVHDEQEAADVGKTTDFLRRVHTEAEEAVRAYLAALQESDPQLKALIAVRDAAAVAVEAMGKHA